VKEPEPLQQIDRTYVRFRNRKLSYFSGCDYFRLASHPKVLAALSVGVNRYGLNVAASRLTSGNHRIYLELERELARFFGTEDALVVSSGYVTNLIVAQALARGFSHALVDEKSHPSLQDAAGFLDCPVILFRHRDPIDVERVVERCGEASKVILLTDGMFAQDGALAPLDQYLKTLPPDALILVDDAHAAGVVGRKGRGSVEYSGANGSRVVQTITLSKAFGVYGGAILGTAALRKQILAKSRLFIGSTPLPLPIANAACKAVEVLSRDPSMRRRLFANGELVRKAIDGFPGTESHTPGPILAVYPKNAAQTFGLERALLAAGIFPPLVRYPGGPPAGYFRFVISSEHTAKQLGALTGVLNSQANLRLMK